jgi:hypothetical protein
VATQSVTECGVRINPELLKSAEANEVGLIAPKKN